MRVTNNGVPAALIVPVGGARRRAHRLFASWLLRTELHCAAGRNPAVIATEAIAVVLDAVALVDVTRGDLLAAGTHAPLRSDDAIHLATALRLGVDEVLTYDEELARTAAAAGVRVLAPGSSVGAPPPNR